MIDVILNWLSENSSTIFLCVMVAVAVWYAAKFYFRRFCKLEENMKNLPCNEHENTLKKIELTLNELKEYLISKHPKDLGRLSAKASPRVLNENGKMIFEKINGQTFIDENREILFKWIDNSRPKTAYDVEMSAYAALIGHSDEDMFNRLKMWVYNSPSMKIGNEEYTATLDDVCFVISLPLRDEYLNKHPDVIK